MSPPNNQRRFDVVVAGGGPTGLASALLAANLGRSTALVAPPRPDDERTTALLAGTTPLFRRFQIWDEIAAAAAPLKRIRIVDASGRLIRAPEVLFDVAEVGLEAFGYNLPNRTLTEILDRAVAATGIVRFQAAAEAIKPGPDSVAIETSTGEHIVAKLLIAADGRHSKAREAAGITVTEWHYEQSALVVNLRHTIPHNDTSTEFHTPTGPFTLVPLGPNRSSLVCVETAEGAARLAAMGDDELSTEIERRSASILGAITVDGPRQVFPLSGMRAKQFAANRIALVGEAAHVIPPIGAQGLNLGLRDVAALTETLAGTSDPGAEGRLAAFDRRRRADVLGRTAMIDGLNRSLLTDSLLVQGARGIAMAALDSIPPLRRAIMRQGLAGAAEVTESKPPPSPHPRQGKRSGGRIRLPIR
jgi:2-octaprenyl-6-methoxyphenol hydroxylase